MKKYKVLTVRQPYANLLCSGEKDVENRGRQTHYRGLLLIHASGKMHGVIPYLHNMQKMGVCLTPIQQRVAEVATLCGFQPDKNFSAIIGYVELYDCVNGKEKSKLHSDWAEKDMWWWLCRNGHFFKRPILGVKGQLGLWDWSGDIDEEIILGKEKTEEKAFLDQEIFME